MNDIDPRTGQDDESSVRNPTESRQGTKGHQVRYVLLLGTIGAVVALGFAYLFFFAA